MRKSGALIWGILILLAAAGLLCYAFMPNLAVFTVPLWKWFAAAALIYWMVRLIFFSNKLSRRLSFVFPLALLFLVFEREIGTLAGRGPNFVNNWVIVLAAALLTAAFHLIFRDKPLVRIKSSNTVYGNDANGGQSAAAYAGNPGTQSQNGTRGAGSYAGARTFSMGSNVCYIDALEPYAAVSNRMGQLDVYYQNVDMGDPAQQVTLAVNNALGQTSVYIPANWRVVLTTQDNLGDIYVRPDTADAVRVFSVTVSNKGGQVSILSK